MKNLAPIWYIRKAIKDATNASRARYFRTLLDHKDIHIVSAPLIICRDIGKTKEFATFETLLRLGARLTGLLKMISTSTYATPPTQYNVRTKSPTLLNRRFFYSTQVFVKTT
jgi:hypothetical protein